MTCQHCGSNLVGANGVCASCGWANRPAEPRAGTASMFAMTAHDAGATRQAGAFGRGPNPGMSLPSSGPGGNNGPGLLSRGAASQPPAPTSAPPAPEEGLDDVLGEDEIEDFCSECGSPIQHGRLFCGNCGAPVNRSGIGQTTVSSRHAAYDSPPLWRPGDNDAPTVADMRTSAGQGVVLPVYGPVEGRTLRIILGVLCILASLVTAGVAVALLVNAFK